MTLQGNESAVAIQELEPVATDRRSDAMLRALSREPEEVSSSLAEIMQQGDLPAALPWIVPEVVEDDASVGDAEAESASPKALPKQRSGTFLHLLWFGYVVFFAVAIPLLAVGGMPLFLSMAVSGCVTGIVWQVMPHKRSVCAWSAVGVYSLIVLGPRLHTFGEQPLAGVVLLGSAALVGWLSSLAPGHCRRARFASRARVAGSDSAD